ncbi:iron-sulfur cluster assembly protein [Rhodopseudomonas pseudopalustris]|uniref:MIP18 family-like domain-containing protein n=1 Tax=Rhodopseudomonas pseudopalustris TaxID=1513892 RepID=A0A1H8XBH4_9BRAD|nr:iron-sulfur cluster assembly protein [Rhodopseudomonas pseudopalustris]SEP37324.1 protein of unknown function DUF59 [Rhodopseudomonas pseudopalustris]
MSEAPVVLDSVGTTEDMGSAGTQYRRSDRPGSAAARYRLELGYNIVDLGLVYDVAIEDAVIANITITTTTRGCQTTNYLKDWARDAARACDKSCKKSPGRWDKFNGCYTA